MKRNEWNGTVVSRQEQRRQKRQAVLMTGARLFIDAGYENTSLDDIAKALNITKRTIYYYVDGKEEILFECNKLGMEFIDDISHLCADEAVPPLDRIRLLVSGYAEWVSTDLGACLVLTKENLLSEERRAVLRESKAKLDGLLRDLIRLGIENGTVSDCDPQLTAAAIFGALNWIPFWNRSDTPVSSADVSEQYIKLFAEGLLVR